MSANMDIDQILTIEKVPQNPELELILSSVILLSQKTTEMIKAAKFEVLRHKFDFDGDGIITLDEFALGCKKSALTLQFQT
eukprot:Awhi_evm1s14565